MALFSHLRDSIDLEDELASLRKEVAALTRMLSKRGAAAYHDTRSEASDLYVEVSERFVAALPVIRRRAHSLEQTVKDNPAQTAAIVGLAALCVAAAVIFTRR